MHVNKLRMTEGRDRLRAEGGYQEDIPRKGLRGLSGLHRRPAVDGYHDGHRPPLQENLNRCS